jgi:hypothetical protein
MVQITNLAGVAFVTSGEFDDGNNATLHLKCDQVRYSRMLTHTRAKAIVGVDKDVIRTLQ